MFLKKLQAPLFACLLGLGPLLAYASELCVAVSDSSDLPLPGASVKATDLIAKKGEKFGAKAYNKSTDSKGRACLTLPEGTYAVEVGLPGFLNVRYYPVRVTYPTSLALTFRLPVGDVTEGGLGRDAILSGTLPFEGKPVEGARICLFRKTKTAPVICRTTNAFGEYLLTVPPGIYRTEIRTARGELYRSSIDVPVPCDYRNRIGIDENQQVPHPGKGRP